MSALCEMRFYFVCVLLPGPRVQGQSDVLSMTAPALTLYTITSAHISLMEASDLAKYDVNGAEN